MLSCFVVIDMVADVLAQQQQITVSPLLGVLQSPLAASQHRCVAALAASSTQCKPYAAELAD